MMSRYIITLIMTSMIVAAAYSLQPQSLSERLSGHLWNPSTDTLRNVEDGTLWTPSEGGES